MRSIKRFFIEDNAILVTAIFSVLMNVLLYYLLFTKIPRDQETITLHYNIFFGIDLIGVWYKVFVIPAIGTVIFFTNFFLAYRLINTDALLRYLLVSFCVVAQLLLLLAGVMVVLFNI